MTDSELLHCLLICFHG